MHLERETFREPPLTSTKNVLVDGPQILYSLAVNSRNMPDSGHESGWTKLAGSSLGWTIGFSLALLFFPFLFGFFEKVDQNTTNPCSD